MNKIIDPREQMQTEPSTATPALKLDAVFLIAPETEIKIHPLAAALPMQEGEESEQLKNSIAAAVEAIIALNLYRRNLTASQRAALAVSCCQL